MSTVITVEPVKGKKHFPNAVSKFSPKLDRQGRINFLRLNEKTGTQESVLTIEDKEKINSLGIKLEDLVNVVASLQYGRNVFNLDDKTDFENFLVLKSNDVIATSLEDVKLHHRFYIKDEASEAQVGIKKEANIQKAKATVLEMTDEDAVNFAILYGKSVNTEPAVAKYYLLEMAAKNPVEMISRLGDKETAAYEILLNKCVEYQIISRTSSEGYVFGEVQLGADTKSAILFLREKKNEKIVSTLRENLKIKKAQTVI